MKLGELIAMNSLRADLFSLVGLAASHGIPSLDGSDGWDKDGITGFLSLGTMRRTSLPRAMATWQK